MRGLPARDTGRTQNRIYNLPNQLSGGQQQRVAIARALVNRPEIIFADEPTGNLDSKTSDEVIALLKMTAKKYGQTIVMITHDDEIAQVADRIPVDCLFLDPARRDGHGGKTVAISDCEPECCRRRIRL